ncbi:hypothetical protein LJC15_04185 [Desulfovibrio sp. OttesenSCG-928-G11]|nr:hypothetical protein [Desulfovibrio sp. OttesenSCG-928-G11]
MNTVENINYEEREEDYFWTQEDFEESITAGIITCFESNIRHNKGAHPKDRISEKHLEFVRSRGLWFFSNTRIVLHQEERQLMPMDIVSEGTWAIGKKEQLPGQYSGYNITMMFRKVASVPSGWKIIGKGQPYECAFIAAHNKGVTGERWYCSVKNDGSLYPCKNLKIPRNIPHYLVVECKKNENDRMWWLYFAMQYVSDAKHTWVISAYENSAKVHLCCAKEEVKSLLYARSLPLTATGRKRPILHLVASHRRRIKEGIEVDVNEFLRGQRTVEMNGTCFTVRPPEKYLEA